MLKTLGTHEVKTTAKLFTLADKCAKAAEARVWHVPRPEQPAADQPGPSRSDKREKKKRRRREAVPVVPAEGPARRLAEGPDCRPAHRAAADRRPAPAKAPAPARPKPGKWCQIHQTEWHDLTECRSVKGLIEWCQQEREEHRRGGNDNAALENQELGFQEPEHTVAFIDGGVYTPSSRRCVKTMRHEVCSATPSTSVTRPLKWSDTPITFSLADHPASTAGVGRLPLVVSLTICNVKVSRVLINVKTHMAFRAACRTR